MAETTAQTMQTLGFLTILQENNGYVGGYLVTNLWGRPLEFRLSTAVQPNRVQQILYGGTLQAYICGDLIGKTLVDKTTHAAQCIFTDCEAVLDLRLRIDLPVVCLRTESSRSTSGPDSVAKAETIAGSSKWPVLCHPRFPEDSVTVRALLERLDGGLDLAEPFVRIREAMSEARKLGVVSRN